jgi:hypothetical protein
MFGGDKLVARICSEVFDIVHEERVGERLLNEEDDLCTPRCETSDYFSPYTRCPSLCCMSVQLRSLSVISNSSL